MIHIENGEELIPMIVDYAKFTFESDPSSEDGILEKIIWWLKVLSKWLKLLVQQTFISCDNREADLFDWLLLFSIFVNSQY